MKTKIEEVQQYFKEKLIKGEYEASNFNDGYFTATIDNKYSFYVWHGSGAKYCKLWNSIGGAFMMLPELTIDESSEMWITATKIVETNNEFIKLVRIESLETELAKLKGVTE